MYVPKVRMSGAGSETLALQGESLGSEFPPGCGTSWWDRVYGEIVSQVLLPTSMSFTSCLDNV